MPRKQNATAVARMACPTCNTRAALYQNVRHFLYLRCANCGTDQGNGQPKQILFWQHAEPIEGAVIQRPPNVPAELPIGGALAGGAPAAVVVPSTHPVPAPIGEPAAAVPAADPVPEPAKPPEKPAKPAAAGGGVFWLVLGLLAAGVATVVSAGTGNGVKAA